MVRDEEFIRVGILSKISEVCPHILRASERCKGEHLVNVLPLRSAEHLIYRGLVEWLTRSTEEHPCQAAPSPLKAHSSLIIRLRGVDVDSGDHLWLSELLRRHEAFAVDAHRILQALRRKVRSKPERQPEHCRQLGAKER